MTKAKRRISISEMAGVSFVVIFMLQFLEHTDDLDKIFSMVWLSPLLFTAYE